MQRSHSFASGRDYQDQMSKEQHELDHGDDLFNAPPTRTVSEAWFPYGDRTDLGLETNDPQQDSNVSATQLNESYADQAAATADAPSLDANTGLGSREKMVQRKGKTNDQTKLTASSQQALRKKYPTLGLSGRIISANFYIPYEVDLGSDGEWTLSNRKGTSALFDSFLYLASEESKWGEHTLVSWTGEIKQSPGAIGCSGIATAAPTATLASHLLSQAAAPIPVDPHTQNTQSHELSEPIVSAADRQRLKDEVELNHGGKVELVWLGNEFDEDGNMHLRDQPKWRQYGEKELFTLFHYQQNEPSEGRAMRENWKWYKKMNEAFADAVIAIYKPGDIVIIHDYQLMLLPAMLRERVPTIYIGFYLHIPFPAGEVYRSLTTRKEVLEGALGANTIGFQDGNYAEHFTSTCHRLLGSGASVAGINHGKIYVCADNFAIGIDTEATIRSAFGHAQIDNQVDSLRQRHKDKRIIIGRDRLDSARGVVQKLLAFEMFLELYSEWRGRVVLIQVTSPTRNEHCGEKPEKTETKISDLAARINGNYGSLSYTPVELYSQHLAKDEYFALLRVADVALITSVRDGMNTTALEYIACQRDNHGPLIISEFSGTAGRLGAAMRINPWSTRNVALTLDKALTLEPMNRAKRHEGLYEYVTTNTVQKWIDRFVRRTLNNLRYLEDQQKRTPLLDLEKLVGRYRNSCRRLFLFDYDGTLTPIVQDPEAAVPTNRIIDTLKTLAADPNNSVWIISGRDQTFLDKHFGHISTLGLSAEHGSFMRMPASRDPEPCTEWVDLTDHLDMSWQNEVVEVFDRYCKIAEGSFVERKKIAITWHYRKVDPAFGAQQAQLCHSDLQHGVAFRCEVDVMTGKANVEVRPRFVNKGEIVKRLINAYGTGDHEKPDFVLCLGDDHTDEDMFRAVRDSKLKDDHAFACHIGADTKQTLAKWHLTEPSFVIDALTALNETRKAPHSSSGTFQAQL